MSTRPPSPYKPVRQRLHAIEKMAMPEVDCSRGAPMGRANIGEVKHCAPGTVHLFKVRMTDAYDLGGAYWGLGETLWCAYSPGYGEHAQPNYNERRAFTRAPNRRAAMNALGLTPEQLLWRGGLDTSA